MNFLCFYQSTELSSHASNVFRRFSRG